MPTSAANIQLLHLEERIDKAIKELSATYPFLTSDVVRTKVEERKSKSDELALRTLREISESLST